jgi:hypothetical protein
MAARGIEAYVAVSRFDLGARDGELTDAASPRQRRRGFQKESQAGQF